MKLAVLAQADSWYARDLQRAAGSDHEVVVLPFSSIQCGVGGEARAWVRCGGVDLTACSTVLVRTMPPGSLEQVVFRMDALARCEAQGVHVVNPPRAIETAVDKFLASAKLAQAGLPTPLTVTCQTVDDAMQAFAELGRDVVIKPLFGSEGRGITRVTDPEIAWRTCKLLTQLGAVLYLQEFVPHDGYDVRLFVVGKRVFGMTRRSASDWRTNVSRGASTEALQVDDELAILAHRAMAAIGAEIAGVDVLPHGRGEPLVLEVNAVPGWQALARTLDVDIARVILDYLSQRPHPAAS